MPFQGPRSECVHCNNKMLAARKHNASGLFCYTQRYHGPKATIKTSGARAMICGVRSCLTGLPKIITTDKLPSYGAAFREIGIANKQLCGGRSNNRCENSHLPFRRRELAMQLFKQQPRPKGLSVITVKYTITSITKDIFKSGRLTNKNAVPLSRSGSKSALHSFE